MCGIVRVVFTERFFPMLDQNDTVQAVWLNFQDTWNEAELDPTKCYLAFETLKLGYGDPGRHYHNFHHILYGLDHFEIMPDLVDGVRNLLLALKLAWIYHDVFNDPASHKGENELRSADIATKAMTNAGGGPSLVSSVHNLIVVTVHDHSDPPETLAEQVIVDIDLISFADAWTAFKADGQRIREEYRGVVPDDAVFWQKRAEVLQGFLDRPHIYYTDICRTLFEKQARENLERAIREA